MAIRSGRKTGADTAWFTNDRFGLFIHWGTYSLAARHEWVKNAEKTKDEDYRKYFDHFDPDLYDPAVWASEARNAGMKYFVVTTKHHEGFCLWDSKYTSYKATKAPAKRDLLKPMVSAFRKEGLKVGFYHSLLDWHHPDFPVDGLHPRRDDVEYRKKHAKRDIRKYARYLYNQTQELVTKFGKVDVMWFDFSYSGADWGWSKGKGKKDWESEKLIKLVRRHQPRVILNDRLEIGGDVKTPEQYQPREGLKVDGKPVVWEACQTLSGSWGYHRDETSWKSVDMLIQMLVDTVSKDGNLLLNVGPNARGELDYRALKCLRGMGKWMRVNSRSIYGCGASSFTPPADCRYTQNGKRLYLHVFAWPFRHIHIEGLAGKIEYAQLLNDASEIRFREGDPKRSTDNMRGKEAKGTVTLELPIAKPPVTVPVIELFLR